MRFWSVVKFTVRVEQTWLWGRTALLASWALGFVCLCLTSPEFWCNLKPSLLFNIPKVSSLGTALMSSAYPCSPCSLGTISKQAHLLPKPTIVFYSPSFLDLTLGLRCFQPHVLFQRFHPTSGLSAQKQLRTLKSSEVLTLKKDINMLFLSQL